MLLKLSGKRSLKALVSGRSLAPLRHAAKKVRIISELLIMVLDSIYRRKPDSWHRLLLPRL